MATTTPPTAADTRKEHRAVIAFALVIVANAGLLFFMFAPPSVLPYLGWYVDMYGPAAVFGLLVVGLAVGWITGYLPRTSPWVVAAGTIVLTELALIVVGTLWLIHTLATVASM